LPSPCVTLGERVVGSRWNSPPMRSPPHVVLCTPPLTAKSEPRALLSASGAVLESVDRLRNGRWISESTAAGGPESRTACDPVCAASPNAGHRRQENSARWAVMGEGETANPRRSRSRLDRRKPSGRIGIQVTRPVGRSGGLFQFAGNAVTVVLYVGSTWHRRGQPDRPGRQRDHKTTLTLRKASLRSPVQSGAIAARLARSLRP
jgi:hypothetical protein